MLAEICKYLNNYFLAHGSEDKHIGQYVIIDGVLYSVDAPIIGEFGIVTVEQQHVWDHDGKHYVVHTSDFLHEDQYFRIVGSVFNDGVYKYGSEELTDEAFDGAVWAMSVPKEFEALVDDITEWLEKDDVVKASESPYTSESFGGYSYSKESGSNGDLSWQGHFASRLAPWRKARVNR